MVHMRWRLGDKTNTTPAMLIGLQISAKMAVEKNRPVPWHTGPAVVMPYLRLMKELAMLIAEDYLVKNVSMKTHVFTPETGKKFLEDYDEIWKKWTGLPIRVDVTLDPEYVPETTALFQRLKSTLVDEGGVSNGHKPDEP